LSMEKSEAPFRSFFHAWSKEKKNVHVPIATPLVLCLALFNTSRCCLGVQYSIHLSLQSSI
jgi:hypothetical protein